jgi:hypothetical protein
LCPFQLDPEAAALLSRNCSPPSCADHTGRRVRRKGLNSVCKMGYCNMGYIGSTSVWDGLVGETTQAYATDVPVVYFVKRAKWSGEK